MLTGKNVYEAAFPLLQQMGPEDLVWENLMSEAQEFYSELAKQLNNSHIAPLQGLVQDFADLIDGDCLELEYIGKKRVTFLERAHILIGKE